MKQLTLITLIVLMLGSCRKDEEHTSSSTSTPSTVLPGITLNGHISGKVSDPSGTPLSVIAVRLCSHQAYTDMEGRYQFTNAALHQNGAVVSVEHPQYWHAARRVVPYLNGRHHANLTLSPLPSPVLFNNEEGLEISSEAYTTSWEAHSVIQPDGAAYSGEVQVYQSFFPHSDHMHIDLVPGGLQGIDHDGKLVSLISYGYLSTALYGEGGALQLNPEAEVDFSIPLAMHGNEISQSSVPLWMYSPGTGYWHPCGEAVYSNGTLQGTLCPTGGFVGIMLPQKQLNLQAELHSESGVYLEGSSYRIHSTQGAVFSGWTSASGVVHALVPDDIPLTLQVYNTCGEQIHEVPMGPLTEDVHLGGVSLENNHVVEWKGVISCNSVPHEGIHVKACSGGECDEAWSAADGSFSGAFVSCNPNEVEVVISLPDNNSIHMNQNVQEASDMGEINICNSEPPPLPESYIEFNFLDGTRLFQEVQHVELFSNLPHRLRTHVDSVYTILELQLSGIGEGIYSGGNQVDISFINGYPSTPSYQTGLCSDFINGCETVTVTITSSGGIGEFIEGHFEGTLTMTSTPHSFTGETAVNGSFRIQRTS